MRTAGTASIRAQRISKAEPPMERSTGSRPKMVEHHGYSADTDAASGQGSNMSYHALLLCAPMLGAAMLAAPCSCSVPHALCSMLAMSSALCFADHGWPKRCCRNGAVVQVTVLGAPNPSSVRNTIALVRHQRSRCETCSAHHCENFF